jgi:hypothetical protein
VEETAPGLALEPAKAGGIRGLTLRRPTYFPMDPILGKPAARARDEIACLIMITNQFF